LKISCIALAGGKSRRLGRNKLIEVIGNKTLFERVIATLSRFECEIIIVTSEQANIPKDSAHPSIKIVKDIFPGRGSLGGIYTGLRASKTNYNIVVACDMPFLSFDLLKYFVDMANGFDLVAYNQGDKFEPLHAVYSQKCIAPIEKMLPNENIRIIELIKWVRVRNISQEEVDRLDPRHLSFFNINTEAELENARKIAEED
jgi:molybdopterin-guanine dinucleotide biosynthesis protein A